MFNQSFIKENNLNTKIINENSSIVFKPNVLNGCVLDDEGSRKNERHIIQNGVLKSFYNNVYSALQLKQSSGNAVYDYIRDEFVISTQDTELVVPQYKLNRTAGIWTVHEFTGMQPVLNYSTSELNLSFIAHNDAFEFHVFNINKPVIEIFNSICGKIGKKKQVDGYTLPGIIVQFTDNENAHDFVS